METIVAINAAQRLDSRGNPTVQVTLETKNGNTFKSIVPSGASKSAYEAIELRDADPTAYHGQGVTRAVANVQSVLGPAIVEKKFDIARDYAAVDDLMLELDGTADKGRLGANAILGVSMACWRAAAHANGVPLYELVRRHVGGDEAYVLPTPFFNVLNGGAHSGNTMPFQEFMVAPVGAGSMAEAVRMGSEVYWELKGVIKKKFGAAAIGIGDEGGFAPPIRHPHEALDLLVEAVGNCGYTGRVKFAIDPASSEFYDARTQTYDMGFKLDDANQDMKYSRDGLTSLYEQLLAKYPIILLEDPFAQDDWKAWTVFNNRGGSNVELVGDDLLATNKKRIEAAKEKGACNALLLKVNQIGSISEAVAAASQAFSYGWSVFVSHRSGETTDDFIADLTVGLGTGHLKSGAPCRGERVVKYNRLMDIEDEIRSKSDAVCTFAGPKFKGRTAK